MNDDDYSESPQDVAADLADFDGEFAGADEKPNDKRTMPDGTYAVRVDKCSLTRTKKSNLAMIAWQLVIIAGPFEGQRLFSNNVMKTDNNARFLKRDLLTCGIDIPLGESLSKNIVRYTEEALDVLLEVKQVTKGENTNLYFNRKIDAAEANNSGDPTGGVEGGTEEKTPPASDDDIPF